MKTVYVVYESSKLGMIPTAYSSNKNTADSFASGRGIDAVVLSQDAEKVEHLLKQLKIKNLDK